MWVHIAAMNIIIICPYTVSVMFPKFAMIKQVKETLG